MNYNLFTNIHYLQLADLNKTCKNHFVFCPKTGRDIFWFYEKLTEIKRSNIFTEIKQSNILILSKLIKIVNKQVTNWPGSAPNLSCVWWLQSWSEEVNSHRLIPKLLVNDKLHCSSSCLQDKQDIKNHNNYMIYKFLQ